MNVRTDIAELLRAGVPQSHISRRLRCAPVTVQRTREALGIPSPGYGRPNVHTSVEDAYRSNTEATGGGHLRWTGYTDTDGLPRLNFRQQRLSVGRIAFRLHHGREPRGRIYPGCGMAHCVAGTHLQDSEIREANRRADTAFRAIFGPTA